MPEHGVANLPLGLIDETSYDQVEVALDKGDLVVFYTDALIEAGDEAGQFLGEQGLLEIVARARSGRSGRDGPRAARWRGAPSPGESGRR